jgi:hypothetical protein
MARRFRQFVQRSKITGRVIGVVEDTNPEQGINDDLDEVTGHPQWRQNGADLLGRVYDPSTRVFGEKQGKID